MFKLTLAQILDIVFWFGMLVGGGLTMYQRQMQVLRRKGLPAPVFVLALVLVIIGAAACIVKVRLYEP